MSYSISFTIDTGGLEPASVGEWCDYTSNVAGMWQLALGHPLSDFDGRDAGDCIEALERAISHMRSPANAAQYEAMNPENGWGCHQGAAEYLEWMLEQCRQHPRATVGISR